MSSGFVPAGGKEGSPEKTSDGWANTHANDDWEKAKEDIENARRRRHEGLQEGGESLFEVLQRNKAAKQDAFEESIRLKNQFRSLDEDEVEFLDSVLESTRAQENAVKKETTERLDIFRKQQEEADKLRLQDEQPRQSETGGSPDPDEEQWTTTGRKRKKSREKDSLRGFKLRKASSANEPPAMLKPQRATTSEGSGGVAQSSTERDAKLPLESKDKNLTPDHTPNPSALHVKPASRPDQSTDSSKATPGLLGLAYDSDEEED
ncbi:MAG: hypothetical protein M4579_000306 [Chaenotheca gracillima]|nr:MAG: hypothetical protein M4579_000306 [Chaenotheca gracillima]